MGRCTLDHFSGDGKAEDEEQSAQPFAALPPAPLAPDDSKAGDLSFAMRPCPLRPCPLVATKQAMKDSLLSLLCPCALRPCPLPRLTPTLR